MQFMSFRQFLLSLSTKRERCRWLMESAQFTEYFQIIDRTGQLSRLALFLHSCPAELWRSFRRTGLPLWFQAARGPYFGFLSRQDQPDQAIYLLNLETWVFLGVALVLPVVLAAVVAVIFAGARIAGWTLSWKTPDPAGIVLASLRKYPTADLGTSPTKSASKCLGDAAKSVTL